MIKFFKKEMETINRNGVKALLIALHEEIVDTLESEQVRKYRLVHV